MKLNVSIFAQGLLTFLLHIKKRRKLYQYWYSASLRSLGIDNHLTITHYLYPETHLHLWITSWVYWFQCHLVSPWVMLFMIRMTGCTCFSVLPPKCYAYLKIEMDLARFSSTAIFAQGLLTFLLHIKKRRKLNATWWHWENMVRRLGCQLTYVHEKYTSADHLIEIRLCPSMKDVVSDVMALWCNVIRYLEIIGNFWYMECLE